MSQQLERLARSSQLEAGLIKPKLRQQNLNLEIKLFSKHRLLNSVFIQFRPNYTKIVRTNSDLVTKLFSDHWNIVGNKFKKHKNFISFGILR